MIGSNPNTKYIELGKMTRGNQREVDRQRAQKKQEDKIKAAGRVSFLNLRCLCCKWNDCVSINNIFHFDLCYDGLGW